MTAARLEIEFERNEIEEVLVRFIRHIAPPRPWLRCPQCGSILYTRRHKLCGTCGEELPPDVLFSEREAARVAETVRIERQRHRQWMRRASC